MCTLIWQMIINTSAQRFYLLSLSRRHGLQRRSCWLQGSIWWTDILRCSCKFHPEWKRSWADLCGVWSPSLSLYWNGTQRNQCSIYRKYRNIIRLKLLMFNLCHFKIRFTKIQNSKSRTVTHKNEKYELSSERSHWVYSCYYWREFIYL